MKKTSCTSQQSRLDILGQRVLGSLRIRLREIFDFDFENVRYKSGDEKYIFINSNRKKTRARASLCGFARVRLCLGKRTIESSLVQFNPKDGRVSWHDESLDIRVRVDDFENGSSALRVVILGGSSRNDLRELAHRKIRFMHYEKSRVVELRPSLRLNEILRFSHREGEMWQLARSRFSESPFSNGKDARYKSVKAELRARFGRSRIDDDAKIRLKRLAANRGRPQSSCDEGECSKELIGLTLDQELLEGDPRPRCSLLLQWVPHESPGILRAIFLEYFVARDEARDERLLTSLETMDLGSSTFKDNTLRIVKVFSCIVGFQNIVLETILWQRPFLNIGAIVLWTLCIIYPQICWSLPAFTIAFVLHLRLSGLRADDEDHPDGPVKNACTSCGRQEVTKMLRSCSGCDKSYCRVCKYLYMLRQDRSKWCHVHCQRGPFVCLSERPLSLAAHQRNARGMALIMGEICDMIDLLDWGWHVGLRDASKARRLQSVAFLAGPVCCAVGRLVPFWIVAMASGWTLLLYGCPLFRGLLHFLYFWCTYARFKVVPRGEDGTKSVDRVRRVESDDTRRVAVKIAKEIQQWTVLSGWTHLAWDPLPRPSISPPPECVWTGLWALETANDASLEWEYTDGTCPVDVTSSVPVVATRLSSSSPKRQQQRRTTKKVSSSPTPTRRRKTDMDIDTKAMWALAAHRFSQMPSNGRDAQYAAVKAEIRAAFGDGAINDSNKSRLRYLAVSRGARLELSQYHRAMQAGDLYRRRVWKREYALLE